MTFEEKGPQKPPIKRSDKASGEQSDPKVKRRGLGLTDKQEELLAKLSPELKAEFKEVFSNKVSTTVCARTSNEPKEYPLKNHFARSMRTASRVTFKGKT